MTNYLRTRDVQVCNKEVKEKFMGNIIFANMYWLPINFFAYQYVPMHLRLLFWDSCGFFYSVGLSYLLNLNIQETNNKIELQEKSTGSTASVNNGAVAFRNMDI